MTLHEPVNPGWRLRPGWSEFGSWRVRCEISDRRVIIHGRAF